MLNEMYLNNIKVNLSAESLGGNILLKIRVGNEHAELSRFITTEEAERPNVVNYWLEHLIEDIVYYCNKKEGRNEKKN